MFPPYIAEQVSGLDETIYYYGSNHMNVTTRANFPPRVGRHFEIACKDFWARFQFGSVRDQ